MGCCQSGHAPEPELPPKSRPRAGAGDAARAGGYVEHEDDVHMSHSEGGAVEEDEEDEGEKSIEAMVESIVTNCCKYFLYDRYDLVFPSSDLGMPEDEYNDLDGDWSIAFDPKMVPKGGIPEPSRQLFGQIPQVLEPSAALALLQSRRPAPCKHHRERMIEICSQLISSVSATSMVKTTLPDGSELKVAEDVNVDQLVSENAGPGE